MSHRNSISQIEQYLTGNMSAEEQTLFEKELAADPSLKAECDFQGEIINGLKEYRKTQLKSRLDAIEVGPGWFEFVRQSALVKSFGGIALATAVGTGVYYIAEKEESVAIEDSVVMVEEIEFPQDAEPIFNWAIVESVETLSERANTSNSDNQALEDKRVEESLESKQTETLVEKGVVSDSEYALDFTAPDGNINQDPEAGLVDVGLDKISETAVTATAEEDPIDVKTENTRSKKLRYKYYDGKLFLTGNFNDQPYEIIEINGADGRRIYLLHNRKYYEIEQTDRLTELPEVRNIKLIQELRLIKSNK